MNKHPLLAALFCPLLIAHGAAIVGPITFSNNASYDANFKESPFDNGTVRNPAGYLQLQGFPYGVAVYDTWASGGINGSGGTIGNDANKNFSNFTISATVASSESGGIGVGFLLRLDDTEENGYFATVTTLDAATVEFDVYVGAGVNAGLGFLVYFDVLPLNNLTVIPNVFYPFKVGLNDGTFSFNFGNGAATSSYTDPFPFTTVGQVGFVLATVSPTAAARLDNFAITPAPEPGTTSLVLVAAGLVGAKRRRSRGCGAC